MKSDYPVVLDACVILPMPLADTLLRMAETPRLYIPKWSDDILGEMSRNLAIKFNKTEQQVSRRENALRQFFPEALVSGYQNLIPVMTNDEKDRHVLAACVVSGAKLIITYNQKHFPPDSLEPYEIRCCGPSTFLTNLSDLQPGIVAQKLTEQAQTVGISIEQLLLKLRVNVPGFVSTFCETQKIDIDSSLG